MSFEGLVNRMNIAIWGAGGFGKYIIEKLRYNDEIHINCMIDNHVKGSIEEINVVSPTEYLAEYNARTDCVLVAFLGGISIKNQLREMGIVKWGVVNDYVYLKNLMLNDDLTADRYIIWNTDKEMDLPLMEYIETNVVDDCNLNCKGCSHFSNMFERGMQIPYEKFERDIRFLSEKIYVRRLNLLGGEVFLNTRILDYVSCLRQYMPKTYVVLVTNGLLVPKLDAKVLAGLADDQVEISISEYPPTSKMKGQIKETLEQYHIRYEFRKSVKTFGKNIDLRGINDPQKAQAECRERTCQFLRDGKIYKCPFSALGNYFFDRYDIPLHFEEGIDIYSEDVNWENLSVNLREVPIELCRYCGVEERFDWEVSMHPQKEEWLV